MAAGLHDKKKAPSKNKRKATKKKAKPRKRAESLSLFDEPVEVTKAGTDAPSPVSPGNNGLSNPAKALLVALTSANDWLGKAELLEASGIGSAQWNRAIKELLGAGLVDKQGELRATKYRTRGDA